MKPAHFFWITRLVFLLIVSFSQNQVSNWEKKSGLSGTDFYTNIIEDLNEGYTVAGSKYVEGNSLDLWIVRFRRDCLNP